jgi:hypothetical protein
LSKNYLKAKARLKCHLCNRKNAIECYLLLFYALRVSYMRYIHCHLWTFKLLHALLIYFIPLHKIMPLKVIIIMHCTNNIFLDNLYSLMKLILKISISSWVLPDMEIVKRLQIQYFRASRYLSHKRTSTEHTYLILNNLFACDTDIITDIFQTAFYLHSIWTS